MPDSSPPRPPGGPRPDDAPTRDGGPVSRPESGGGTGPPDEGAAARLALCQPVRRHVEACLAEIEAAVEAVGADESVQAALEPLRAVRDVLADDVVAGETDLGLGRRLMEALVPRQPPETRGVSVAVRVAPSDAVGGNVCLLLPVNTGHLVIAVLDSSGQGLPVACLSVWAALELTRGAFTGLHSPRSLLDRLNGRLVAQAGGRYLRAFAADLDLDLMEMRYVNASHCEPLWLRGNRIESVDTQGLFVGLFEDAEYEEKSLQMAEGEGLLFYSDSVVDALRNRAGLVEPAGLLSLVEDHLRDDAAALINAIAGQVQPEGPRPHDDVVILAIRCRHIEEWHAVVIPSDFDESKHIADAILEHLTLQRFAEPAIFATKLALEEALANAIKHGNKGDPTKRVHVKYCVGPDRTVIVITDEGPGFDPSDIPDPTADERLEVPTGRGLLLMRAYMDGVEFNASGNQIKLTRLNK